MKFCGAIRQPNAPTQSRPAQIHYRVSPKSIPASSIRTPAAANNLTAFSMLLDSFCVWHINFKYVFQVIPVNRRFVNRLLPPGILTASPVTVDFLVQRENAVGEASDGQILQRLGVDLHAAVDEVDLGEQLCLGAHRAHSRAELRFAMV